MQSTNKNRPYDAYSGVIAVLFFIGLGILMVGLFTQELIIILTGFGLMFLPMIAFGLIADRGKPRYKKPKRVIDLNKDGKCTSCNGNGGVSYFGMSVAGCDNCGKYNDSKFR